MIKAVLFDFDGTLINTNDLIFKSYDVAFKTVLNRSISMEEILSLYGKPLYASLGKYGEAQERLYQVYREYNEAHHDEMVKPFDGACEGVQKIVEKGYRVGIVTSKRLDPVRMGIKVVALPDVFDPIITPIDTEKTKPEPEPVLCGCMRLGLMPEEVIYVGDSIFDMEAGSRAGTKLCAVKYSVTPIAQLCEFKPEYVVDTILDLANLLEDIR